MGIPVLHSKVRIVAAIVAAMLFLTSARAEDHETVLYNFGQNSPNDYPGPFLLRDAVGNLYGVSSTSGTHQCGIYGCGTVYELSPLEGGGWSETVVHDFANGTDGAWPNGLMLDAAGNLYGMTMYGGLYGAGIVYELSPGEQGWTETVLYNFPQLMGWGSGNYNLIKDAAGNLYGTMFSGGDFSGGVVFELSPSGGGEWTKTVLHSFGHKNDGQSPESGVIMDAAGNLYGTTIYGGTGCSIGCGTVYELSPGVGGVWVETVLHDFNGDDGAAPWASLVMDAVGNLYGTASQGGTYCPPFGCGTAFELSPGDQGWTETVLHSFNDNGQDGWQPLAALSLDTQGNLYGTTFVGGSKDDGTVFELSPRGGWSYSILHNFGPGNEDGFPSGGVAQDRAGNLYGTANGGLYEAGVAYELTPATIRPGATVVH